MVNFQKDKLAHVVLGLIVTIFAFVGIKIFLHFGIGWFFAYSTTLVGIGYEVNQYIRKSGKVEILDAIATATPGWIALLFLG
jgi:hypothetical protein